MTAFTVAQKTFVEAVTAVAKRLPTRPSEPVTACVKMQVFEDSLRIGGYDYQVATARFVEVTDGAAGAVVVSGRLLAEVVKTFAGDQVSAGVQGEELVLRCGRDEACLPLVAERDYPSVPAMPPVIGTVDTGEFTAAIKRCGGATDRAENAGLIALTGMHLTFADTHIRISATDRYQAAIHTVEWQSQLRGAHAEALVRAVVLLDTADVLAGAQTRIGLSDPHLLGFDSGSATVTTSLMIVDNPIHPNLPRMFSEPSETPAIVSVELLRRALQGMVPLLDDPTKPAVLTFDDGDLTIEARRSQASKGSSTRVVACDYTGPAMTFGIKPSLLLATLSAVGGAQVACHLYAPQKSIMVTRVDEPEGRYRHLVMPVHPRFY